MACQHAFVLRFFIVRTIAKLTITTTDQHYYHHHQSTFTPFSFQNDDDATQHAARTHTQTHKSHTNTQTHKHTNTQMRTGGYQQAIAVYKLKPSLHEESGYPVFRFKSPDPALQRLLPLEMCKKLPPLLEPNDARQALRIDGVF